MIFNVKGRITIDGVPAHEVVAAAVRHGWIRFPVRTLEFDELSPGQRFEELPEHATTEQVDLNG